jgi:hypothetical protein
MCVEEAAQQDGASQSLHRVTRPEATYDFDEGLTHGCLPVALGPIIEVLQDAKSCGKECRQRCSTGHATTHLPHLHRRIACEYDSRERSGAPLELLLKSRHEAIELGLTPLVACLRTLTLDRLVISSFATACDRTSPRCRIGGELGLDRTRYR